MDAVRAALVTSALIAMGAGYRTPNFVVQAPTPQLAREIGDAAERFRRELSELWLGRTLPNWSRPCPISARVKPGLGAGGATTFLFDRGEVYGWRMNIQGSRKRVLDSVLPHEVTHTIFASHFRQALPRWADEGACTTVEHPSERAKQEKMLINFLTHRRGISFSRMFAMKEYPRDIMPLYSQGHSVARFLIAQGGRRKFVAFLGDGLEDENWPRAIRQHYGYENLLVLQNSWVDWVRDGSPADVDHAGDGDKTLLANAKGHQRTSDDLIYRAQSADAPAKMVPVPRASVRPAKSAPRSDSAVRPVSSVYPVADRPTARPAPRRSPESHARRASGESTRTPQASGPPRERTLAGATAVEQKAPAHKAPGGKMLEWSRPRRSATPARIAVGDASLPGRTIRR